MTRVSRGVLKDSGEGILHFMTSSRYLSPEIRIAISVSESLRIMTSAIRNAAKAE